MEVDWTESAPSIAVWIWIEMDEVIEGKAAIDLKVDLEVDLTAT